MKRKPLLFAIAMALLIIGFVGVRYFPDNGQVFNATQLDSIPTKRDLRSSFFEKGELLVLYAAKDTLISQNYRSLLKELSSQEQSNSWRTSKIKFKNANTVTDEDLKSNSLFLVGAINDNPILQRFIANTPFSINKKEIKIGTKKFLATSSILSVSFYPNPLQPNIPFSFLTGTDAQEVFDFFAARVKENGPAFYWQHLDYELYRQNARVVLGDFNPLWNTETDTFFDFSSKPELVLKTDHYHFINHQDELGFAELKDISVRMETTIAELAHFVDSKKTVPILSYHMYRNMEEKGLITGNTDHSHIDTVNNGVHTIVNEIYKDNDLEMENALVLRHILGPSKSDILETGLPLYFTDTWQVKGYKYWSARLVESSNTLSVKQLFDPAYMAQESPLIRDCLAATLVDFLLKYWGKNEFLNVYTNFDLEKLNLRQLEAAWKKFLSELPKELPSQKKVKKQVPYLKGFNFAHEGYRIYNGYGSKKATASLLKQKQLGSNAMAIVPYSFIPDVNKPSPFRFSDSAGNENDEAIVHSTFKAGEMGMFTLLKPQIFVGGSWPGGIEMLTDADWKTFFDHYYRWIRHYAFLAEIHQIDGLCLGVEFTKASLTHPEAWREMIKKTRGLFSGQLTYAANWGEEFENIEFWDDLDFIGLNSYYPLSEKDNPTDEELSLKFDTIKTRIQKVYDRFEKPIVFTEIGFRSIDHPWKKPHAEADESINQLAQQRCYEVIFKGIQNEPWCQGILWWKFPSYLEYRGTDNNAFTPNNKLAEETVRTWFAK